MNQLSWFGLGMIAALGGAGVAIFGRIGLSNVDATLATTVRSVIMAVILLGVSATTGKFSTATGAQGLDGRAWAFIVLAGLSGAISWLAYFGALQVGAATKVAAVDRLSLAFVLLFATAFLNEHYAWRGWLGIGLMVLGVSLVASD